MSHSNLYGDLLIVRPPVIPTCNKAGANYKSEVKHLEYSPLAAYDEWLAICDSILDCGGDALFLFEDCDEAFLDYEMLSIGPNGHITAEESHVLGMLEDVMTGRVFTANGPWLIAKDGKLSALMPHMLAHRKVEEPYYEAMCEMIADAAGLSLEVTTNPHRWEGMADVAIVGNKVVFTYAVSGHYDEATEPKSPRSSLAGVTFAADWAQVVDDQRCFVELVYPHFHGDTVHFAMRPVDGAAFLAHFPKGLWRDESSKVTHFLGSDAIAHISREDAQDAYASNSRQLRDGLLVPQQASKAFKEVATSSGLSVKELSLNELFGKAGGGPACATLYVPSQVRVPANFPLRYSLQREAALKRRERIPKTLTVDKSYFDNRKRG